MLRCMCYFGFALLRKDGEICRGHIQEYKEDEEAEEGYEDKKGEESEERSWMDILTCTRRMRALHTARRLARLNRGLDFGVAGAAARWRAGGGTSRPGPRSCTSNCLAMQHTEPIVLQLNN